MSTNKEQYIDQLLKSLLNKKVQVYYVGADQEETSAAGRLLEVTKDIIKIDGAITTVVLLRRHIRVSAVDYVKESDTLNDVKLWIRCNGEKKLTARVFGEIGRLVQAGRRSGENEPVGFDWTLHSLSVFAEAPKQKAEENEQ